MTLPPELVDFARQAFTLAGGADSTTWSAKVELGLQGVAIGTGVLAVLVATIAIVSRDRIRG